MDFRRFLAEVKTVDLAPAFFSDDRPCLTVDTSCAKPGLSLEKGNQENILGQKERSVIAIVLHPELPLSSPAFLGSKSLADLTTAFSWVVEDASPDSVTSLFFLAARLANVELPNEVRDAWFATISDWEATGIVDDPNVSWPALAAALSHTLLGSTDSVDDHIGRFAEAWQIVLRFLLETLEAGWPPDAVPADAQGRFLQRARSALREEQFRYERKLFAQQIFQLSLPIQHSQRRRLVDVILTEEDEFTGALKVFARNDRKNSPLGRGFSVIIMVRPGNRLSNPSNWVTVSLDVRQTVQLMPLWEELERLERQAWEQKGLNRPKPEKGGRELYGIPPEDQPYEQPWYIDPVQSLVASPGPVKMSVNGEPQEFGSQLTLEQVLDAVFRLFDPFGDLLVEDLADGGRKRLPDVKCSSNQARKYVLAARWSRDDPLPHPASPIPMSGLFPLAVRVMGARTLGIIADEAIAKAPDLEAVELVSFGSGLAAMTDGGVFLLDPGRRQTVLLQEASELVNDMANLAHRLDDIQAEISERANLQAEDIGRFSSTRKWVDHQRFCASMTSEMIRLLASLDEPLDTKRASLQPLKTAISNRWNIRRRLDDLTAALDALQQNGRVAEEIRTFHAARFLGASAFAIVLADALASRTALAFGSKLPSGMANSSSLDFQFFWGIAAMTLLGLWLAASLYRQRPK